MMDRRIDYDVRRTYGSNIDNMLPIVAADENREIEASLWIQVSPRTPD